MSHALEDMWHEHKEKGKYMHSPNYWNREWYLNDVMRNDFILFKSLESLNFWRIRATHTGILAGVHIILYIPIYTWHIVGCLLHFFVPTDHSTSLLFHSIMITFFLCLSYVILAVPMRRCLGEQSCKSSTCIYYSHVLMELAHFALWKHQLILEALCCS